MEDFTLRRVINDYMKEVCHYSQKQVFANSSYQRNYFQSQIDDAIEGLINFLQLYYNSDRKQRPFSAQEDQVLIEQYVEEGRVSQYNMPASSGVQPGFRPGMQPGVQPGIQPGVQPGIQPGVQPGIQPGVQPGIQPGVQPGIQPGGQPGIQPGVQPGIQPGVQPEIQPGVQPGIQPETQPGNAAGTGNQRAFTVEELSRYNGSNGNPAYVAVNGIVYDVSNVMRWAGGSHFGLMAGQDHTSDFMDCHGGMAERLQSLPVVGTLVTS